MNAHEFLKVNLKVGEKLSPTVRQLPKFFSTIYFKINIKFIKYYLMLL